MGTVKSIDVRIAIFFRRCFNYYIKKRTFTPPPPTQDEIWESLFLNTDNFTLGLGNDIRIILFKDSKLCKLIYFGFEQQEITFLTRFLKKGDVFFDIGANIGLYSLNASKIIGENGKVFTFEPTPSTFSRLLRNISLNNFNNIKVHNIGLSNAASILDFNISNNGYDAWNSFTDLDKSMNVSKIKVNVDTLDAFIEEEKINRIDLIKLDVEGWEKFVIEGAVNLLKKDDSPVFLVEFTETNAFAAGYYLGELYDLMKTFGYDWYSYNAETNSLIKETKKLHYPYENLIAIRDYNACFERLNK